MSPEHTALVAELEARELYDPKYGRNCKDQMSLRSAAAIRALAGENERLTRELNMVTRGDVSPIITTLGDALTYIAKLEARETG